MMQDYSSARGWTLTALAGALLSPSLAIMLYKRRVLALAMLG